MTPAPEGDSYPRAPAGCCGAETLARPPQPERRPTAVRYVAACQCPVGPTTPVRCSTRIRITNAPMTVKMTIVAQLVFADGG